MSQHDLAGDRRRSRALIGESWRETSSSPVKLQNRRHRRKQESALVGKLTVREGDNPDRG
jgi:hypothetical protein